MKISSFQGASLSFKYYVLQLTTVVNKFPYYLQNLSNHLAPRVRDGSFREDQDRKTLRILVALFLRAI